MDYGLSDTSGTDDDLPPPPRNRFQSRVQSKAKVRSTAVCSSLPRTHNDMETQIHNIEQEAYSSVLRAFKAQSDAITWEKESLITELRRELRVSDEEHRELLSRVNSDDIIRRIREWRKTRWLQPEILSTGQPTHDHLPSPTVSASRKKQKRTQSVASMSIDAPTSNLRSGPAGPRSKNSKSSMQHLSTGLDGRSQVPNRGSSGAFTASEPAERTSRYHFVGSKVWTRWPDDNHFYEAVITDYNPVEGRHALVYDIDTDNETWEWVNLAEISPEDIRWEGEDPGIFRRAGRPGPGRGNKKPMSRGGAVTGAGRGRGITKIQSNSQSGIGNTVLDDIEILHTDTLIKEVERVLNSRHPDPIEIENAAKVLNEHEQALVDAIARLDDASDGESDQGDQHFPQGQSMDHDGGLRSSWEDISGEGRVAIDGSDGRRAGESRTGSDYQQDEGNLT